MAIFNLPYERRNAQYKSNEQVDWTANGYMTGWGTTTYRDSIENWAPGALFKVNATAVAGSQTYVNQNTSSSATWVEVGDAGAGGGFTLTGSIAATDAGDMTFGTGSDVKFNWDGSTMNVGPPTGFWSGCPLLGYGYGHRLAYEFFDHFTSFSIGSTTSLWTAGTNTNGAVALGSAETASTPGLGGYVTLETDGTAQFDYATIKVTSAATGAPFKITKDSGKKLWYECRIMVSSVTDVNIMVGLFNANVDDMSVDATGAEAVQDGVYHRTLVATETEIDFAVNKDTTETEVKANGGTLAAATAIILGFKFDGVSTLTSWVNDVAQATTSEVDAANFPSDQGLTPGFFIKDAEAAGEVKKLHVDYVRCVQLV